MRMWMIEPKYLCINHLLGEHKELHMIVGSILKNKSIKGFIEKGLIEIHNINNRHRELIGEFKKRKYEHKSPLPYFIPQKLGNININNNLEDLKKRCSKCRERIKWMN